jgi:DNA-binding MurR/RpiR family transcriptional regulator
MTLIRFEELVLSRLDRLSPGQKRVAEHMLRQLDKSSYDTIAIISKEVGVSETTVIRLAYALGFNSFSEMQRVIRSQILGGGNGGNGSKGNGNSGNGGGQAAAAAIVAHPFAAMIENDIRILQQLSRQLNVDQVQDVIGRLIQADNVYVAGGRTSYSAAVWFSMALGFLRENVTLVPPGGDVFNQLLGVTRQSAVVAISFPRYAKETQKFAATAKELGASIIAITDHRLSPIGSIADVSLFVGPNRDQIGINSVSAVISLLNLVVTGVRMSDHTRATARLQKLENLYSQYGNLIE